MRERRTFGQWFRDGRSRLVPLGCAVALFAVTLICVVAVVAPSLGTLLAAARTGAAQATSTPASSAPSSIAEPITRSCSSAML